MEHPQPLPPLWSHRRKQWSIHSPCLLHFDVVSGLTIASLDIPQPLAASLPNLSREGPAQRIVIEGIRGLESLLENHCTTKDVYSIISSKAWPLKEVISRIKMAPVGKASMEELLQKYESSNEKLEATLKNDMLVTNGNDWEVTSEKPSSNPRQHSDDPSKSRKKTGNRAISFDGRVKKQRGSTASDERKKRRKCSSFSSDSESYSSESDSFSESDSDSSSSSDGRRRKKRPKNRNEKQNKNKRKGLTARSSKRKSKCNSDDGKENHWRVVKAKHNPQSGSARKEEPEAKLQKDNDSKKYESSDEKLEATLKNNVLVTTGNPLDPLGSLSSLGGRPQESKYYFGRSLYLFLKDLYFK
ncbi:hypothetical protein L1987_42946 [Smallanthus sonchifolius]|uniref:Uncharacterized protein n=1 Tax=Smallanthus sonchifolius TaxID=185202 RepID=A0ACB9GLC3_9ASTR|nr:hypothetical protein L1987_42946 [Smallanthus sonchifolius]